MVRRRDGPAARLYSTGQRHRALLPIARAVPAVLIAAAFVYFAVGYVGHVATIRNVDYFPLVEMAQGLDSGSLRSWVSGMHPVGYSLLVRWGLCVGLDAVQIGKGLSVVGGLFLLSSAYLLAHHLTDSHWLALLTGGFLATTGYFLFFATLEGNDMLSAGLQGLSLALLVGLPESKRLNFAAGLLAGLAYIIRYTAGVTSAFSLLFLAVRALVQRRRSMWVSAGLFLAGFLIGAGLQLVPSTLVTGNPFYSVQGHNVWWHMEGLSDFATEWHLAPMDISPVQVFLANPARFIRHWWDTAKSFWVDPDMLLLDAPLRLLSQAGFLFTLLAGREIKASQRGLLALYVCGLLAALAIIRYDPRFLIGILPVLAFCAVYFVWRIVPGHLSVGHLTLPVNAVVLAALLAWSIVTPVYALRSAPKTDMRVVAVTNVLRAGGMESASEVLSSAIPFHDVSLPARTRYDQSYWLAPDMNSLEELHALAGERGYRFVLYDANTGLEAHPGLEGLLNPAGRPAGLTPLLIPENRQYVLYRVESDPPRPSHPLDVHLEGGITLVGYDLYVAWQAPDKVAPCMGVFLYWQATQPVTDMLKVFVHVMDAAGELVAQHDAIPALWTYPADRWAVGETVVDFHPVLFETALPSGSYTIRVGLYEEDAGRVAVLDSSGAPAGTDGPPVRLFVELQTLTVP